MQFPSYIAGPFFMAVGFILSAVIVVGVKSVILFVREKLKEKFLRQQMATMPMIR